METLQWPMTYLCEIYLTLKQINRAKQEILKHFRLPFGFVSQFQNFDFSNYSEIGQAQA
jgi:hypothetical protein